MRRPLRLATRGSALALAQARLVAADIEREAPHAQVEVVPVRTSGDERPATASPAVGRDGPMAGDGALASEARGDKARFVKEIEEALLAGEADLAVHSAKDVPSELPAGLSIVGVPSRAGATDALCGAAGLEELRDGAVVGTASLRRRAQLAAARPDLEVVDLRGNVDTRLRRLRQGDYEAIVLASAGLERLGLADGTPLPMEKMTPAPGQGCLALEGRSGDELVAELAATLTDRPSLLRLTAERALVAELQATCRTPVGAHAAIDGDGLALSAFVGLPDGSAWIRDEVSGPAEDPGALGRTVAQRLLTAGARELLAAAERWEG